MSQQLDALIKNDRDRYALKQISPVDARDYCQDDWKNDNPREGRFFDWRLVCLIDQKADFKETVFLVGNRETYPGKPEREAYCSAPVIAIEPGDIDHVMTEGGFICQLEGPEAHGELTEAQMESLGNQLQRYGVSD